MQQPRLRASQSETVKLSNNAGPQPPLKSHQGLHHVDASPQVRSWNAGRLLLWACKGWWDSAVWWSCFACGLLVWCLAKAKEDDGGDFAGTLHFCLYFARVRPRALPCRTSAPPQSTLFSLN